MSLRTRLILSYILIIILCLSIVAAALLILLQDYRDRITMARLTDMSVPTYVQVRAVAQGRITLNQLWANMEELAQETGVYFFLLDAQNNVIKEASPNGSSAAPPPNKLLKDRLRPYRGTYATSDGRKLVFIAYPLSGLFKAPSPANPNTLIVAMPRSLTLGIWTELAKPFLWAGIIALIVSIVIAIFLARSVYLPIQRLAVASEEIAQGKYDQEITIAGSKEVKGLAIRFNQMSKQVKRSQQTLRNFVADAAHELRSPLTSIKGFAQAILDGTAMNHEAQIKAAGIIEDEAKRMMRLVDDLLELSKLESGQVNMVKEPVDLKELLQQCHEVFLMRAEEKGLQLITDIEPLPPVVGDTDRMEQVFSNLLDNAIKHTPPGGKVHITGQQSALDFAEITVSDTGPGIPPEQLPHLFERFYRADASSAKTGTGLGLAIAREIVRAHGGNVSVSSTTGKGTEFVVRLPCRRHSSQ